VISVSDLVSGEIEVVGLLPYASNYTYLAKLLRPGQEPTVVVYKPQKGEAPLWDFPFGSLGRREVAAYLVSEAAGWNFVPATVFRSGPHGPGAVQLFIEHDPATTAFDLISTHVAALKRIALFDLVVNNADRKAGHVLQDSAGRIWAVDHGICFHVQPKLRTVLWDFIGHPIPPDDRAALERLCGELEAELSRLLGTLLDPKEIDALMLRAAKFAAAEVFPQPGPGRSYPWPAI
jgi:hypothetical protein